VLLQDVKPSDVLSGPYFPEKVKVLAVKQLGPARVKLEAVGVSTTKRYYDAVLAPEEVARVDHAARFACDLELAGSERRNLTGTEDEKKGKRLTGPDASVCRTEPGSDLPIANKYCVSGPTNNRPEG